MLKNKMFATCLGLIISAATIMLPTDVFAKTYNITVDKNENLQLEDGRLELQNKVDKFMETALASDSSLDKEAVSEFSSDFLTSFKPLSPELDLILLSFRFEFFKSSSYAI